MLFNGVKIVPNDWNTSFANMGELSSIFTAVDFLHYCEGTNELLVINVAITDKMGGIRDG